MKRAAWLLAAMACITAAAQARPGKRLEAHDKHAFSFLDLLEAHIQRALGAIDRLPSVPAPAPIEPSVYVTLAPRHIMVWDEDLIALDERSKVASAALANCPPLCIPKLRAAAARALVEERDRLAQQEHPRPPRVLFVADRKVPYRTFLAAAYSIATATDGTPPAIYLAVTGVGAHAGKVGAIRFFVTPPHTIKLAENANPLLAELVLDGSKYVVRARSAWLPDPETFGSLQGVLTLLGEIKARDPGKTVAFFRAPPDAPLESVIKLVGGVRQLYPDVMLGGVPHIVGPSE